MIAAETRVSPAIATVLKKFGCQLRAEYGDDVLRIRLFGSFARGGANEESDVDVAVVLTKIDWPTRRRVIDIATDIGLAHDVYLSPTLFDRVTFERWRDQDRPLVRDIEREGLEV